MGYQAAAIKSNYDVHQGDLTRHTLESNNTGQTMFWFLLGVLVVNAVVVVYCMFGQKLVAYLRKIMLLDEDFETDPEQSDVHDLCLHESSVDLTSFSCSDR